MEATRVEIECIRINAIQIEVEIRKKLICRILIVVIFGMVIKIYNLFGFRYLL